MSAFASSLSVALKEWAAVVSALAEGRQILLLRKGGIYESGGEFELEHRQFLLFPTWLHQNPQMIKEQERQRIEARSAEPPRIELTLLAEVTDIVQLQSRAQTQRIDAQHIWTAPLIEMRFNYRPENPLYLLLLRAYRLQTPQVIDNTPAYAGCKSWVPLERPLAAQPARPALEAEAYEMRRREILDAIAQP